MLKYKVLQVISLAILFSTLFALASAQEFRGSIQGKVLDPNGAIVPGATVTIKNAGTNVESSATTNDEGSYNFSLLQPGKYTLSVTSQGFSPATRELEVRVADKLTVDVANFELPGSWAESL